MQTTDTVVRARIESHLKAAAKEVLDEMGLSFSDAIRLMLLQVVAKRGLPFEVRALSKKDVAAFEAAERSEGLTHHDDAESLIEKLRARP
ncbi:type II toxin-antitoxin system RelB/DinJ family antitoxin [Pseudomonas aeruginosa]|uniref:type II toxin-antitoxin system RelB/DinJ family antitoxin n=1 Tax=Pseudomonas aeruginosa TaxID=287 RepID=UPI000FC407C1|nr:type II toxin-antitoxin system RelB/DinJ family antitoxin [Pseudomonas aeruginosa]RUC71693.1 type II toxin-antitoxin system RelB/DinJ family antitoxin [Pseudomonas aeruginosa]